MKDNTVDWSRRLAIPSPEEIRRRNRPGSPRSPYLTGWMSIPVKYTEFYIEFKADLLPPGTYCCLGCWSMDHMPLKARYPRVRTDGWAHGYAGFQRTETGYVSILSLWDVFCGDSRGTERVLRAKRVYPSASSGKGTFDGEGTGVHSIRPCDWSAGTWYGMHLRCRPSKEGTTVVEQWLTEPGTPRRVLLSAYDTGIPDTSFTGSLAVFLENYLSEYAGEMRTMEFRKMRYRRKDSGEWETVSRVFLESNGGLPAYEGSYRFGGDGTSLWMITSGVGGDWYGTGIGPGRKGFDME